jgi:hypothetical protein
LSFSDPDGAELETRARERSCLWLRDVVWRDRSGVSLSEVDVLCSRRVDSESHEGVGVCEIEHLVGNV